MSIQQIVIVGGGFGGVSVALQLAKTKNCQIHLIDCRNFHLFQPLLYQVAMAGLNPSDIAVPFRRLFANQKNIQVTLAEVDKINFSNCKIHYDDQWLDYDYLVLSAGAKHFYFGNDDWERVAPGLKTLEQATEIRRRVLTAFEYAEKEQNPSLQESYLTFVIVGGGPTGVELAGAIAEMAKRTLYRDYRHADLTKTKVILVEAGPRLLATFPAELSAGTLESLRQLGVEVLLNVRAENLSSTGLNVGDKYIATRTIIWAAGVMSSRLSNEVPAEKDPLGRVYVQKDLSIPGYINAFVIGDQAIFENDEGFALPGIAPVAIQQGKHVARNIERELKGLERIDFKYSDRGMMATIGRSRAVVCAGGYKFQGFFAWLTWVFVHIVFLMRFRNRFFVFLQWIWSYFRFGYGARLILHKNWRFYSKEHSNNLTKSR